jgi:deoxyribodipyrimidine photo-lyase
LWKAGEEHAARRLGQFVGSRIDDYKTRRNFPAVNGTSTMSPYLTMGVVSPRQCFAAGVEANGGRIAGGKAAIKSWLDELVWREFYKHVLIGWPKVSMRRAYRAEYEQIHWNDDEQLFERWCEGMTGVPLVDAGMRQLNQTGWMHNRVRMVVAMYLTKDMFIDWRWGERYFMQKLVDGDLASNNGGWQWSASTGTDAAPYFRIFNPVSQSERFDADGKFIRQFVPELKDVPAKYIHDPYAARGKLEQLPDYPEPAVDHQQARQAALEAFKALKS